jgi:hypothetical protein
VREAVIAYCAAKGKGREKIVSRMQAEARAKPHARGQDPENDNIRAFETRLATTRESSEQRIEAAVEPGPLGPLVIFCSSCEPQPL